MQTIKWIISTLLLISFYTHAEEGSDALPLTDASGDTSAIVGGCVNVITGTYFDFETDIILPGPKEMHFSRSFYSSENRSEDLGKKWMHSLQGYISARRLLGENRQFREFNFVDAYGAVTAYHAQSTDGAQTYRYNHRLKRNFGATNVGQGEISGKTNLINTRIYSSKWGGTFTDLVNGAGDRKKFVVKHVEDEYRYLLQEEIDASGHTTKYNPLSSGKTNTVDYFAAGSEDHFGGFSITPDIENNSIVTVKASDGRQSTYRYNYILDKNKKRTFKKFLTEVNRPNGAKQKYHYYPVDLGRDCLLTKKENPDNRFIKINYLSPTELTTKNPSKKTSLKYRVTSLEAPVGIDSQPKMLYQFNYRIDKVKEIDGNSRCCGHTLVIDALNRKKIYRYNYKSLLTDVEHFDGNKLFRTTKTHWIESGPLHGSLSGQVIFDSANQPVYTKFYSYDERGNIRATSYSGNLTGKSVPIKLKNDGIPNFHNGTDLYTVHNTHSNDGKNLKLSEGDFRRTVEYRYKWNTDIPSGVYVKDSQGKIRKREMYYFNGSNIQTVVMVDDGSSYQPSDLTGVTQRKITRITPKMEKPCYGLPHIVEEFYLDLETNQEILLKKTVNTYSKEGWKIKEEIYDSNNEYQFESQWEYNSMGQITKETNPLGHTTIKEYDANGNLIYEYGPKPGNEKVYTHDFANRLIRLEEIDDGVVLTTKHSYDAMGNRTTTEDASGNVIHYTYNHLDKVVRIDFPDSYIIKEYDVFGNVTKEMESSGATIQKVNNVRGQPIVTTYPDGTQESCEYTLDGLLEKKTERNHTYHLYTYDYQKRPLKTTTYDPSGNPIKTVTSEYNAFNKIYETDGEGNATYFTYDGAGRLIKECKGEITVRYEYDTLGRQTKLHTGDINTLIKTYDPLNQVLEERLEDQKGNLFRKTTFTYDEHGNVTSQCVHLEDKVAMTRTDYNSQKLPTKTVDAEGNVTQFFYDYTFNNDLGQAVVKVTCIDPLGNVTETVTDRKGKEVLTIRKNAFGDVIAKTHIVRDGIGNPIEDRYEVYRGKELIRTISNTREFDLCNRTTTMVEGAGTPEQKITRYTYTLSGEQETVSKPDGVTLYHSYDPHGRLLKLQSSDQSIEYNYQYDLNDNPIVITDKAGERTYRQYDANCRLTKETLANGLAVAYTYDQLGRKTQITLPDKSTVAYTYDAANLKSVQRKNFTHKYLEHDLAGNIIKSQGIAYSQKTLFAYTLKGQLESIIHPHFKQKDFKYDAVGNLTEFTLDNRLHTFKYDDSYQLEEETGFTEHKYAHDSLYNRLQKDDQEYDYNALNQRKNESYTATGNLETYNGYQLTYDALDRLIEAKNEKGTYRYSYDSFNRRTHKTDQKGNVTAFIYQDRDEVGSYKNGKCQDLRVLGTGRAAEIGASVIIESDGWTYAPVHDHYGNVAALISTITGYATQRYRYSAFGEQTKQGGYSPWRYQGKRVDEETGLVNFGRRYYCPDRGRWLTPDPIGFEGGPNLYAYINNNPLIYVDEYGLLLQFPIRNYTDYDDFLYPWVHTQSHGFGYSIVDKRGGESKSVNVNYLYGNYKGTCVTDDFLTRDYCQGQVEYHTAGTLDPGRHGQAFTNGVMNKSVGEAMETANKISEYSGGYQTTLIFNPSVSLAFDTYRYRDSAVFRFATPASLAIANHVIEHFDKYGLEGSTFTLYAHSEGLNNCNHALLMLDSEIRKRVTVIGLAPSIYINPNLCERVQNYVCNGDPVTYADLIGRIKFCDTISMINCNPLMGLHYHSLSTGIYDDSIKKEVLLQRAEARF